MKIIWKVIIIIIIVGLILATIGLATGASRTLFLDRRGVHVGDGEINEVSELDLVPFKNIHVDVGLCDIELVSSDKYGIHLIGRDMKWSWSVENDVLSITHDKTTRVQIVDFGILSGPRNCVTVYLPENVVLEQIYLKSGSGDIELGNLQADRIEISNSFGNVDMNSITSDYLSADISSGRFTGMSLKTQTLIYNNRFGDGNFQAVSADYINAESNSGKMHFTNCEFKDATISNSFGDIIATGLISSKSNIKASSGDIKISGDLSGETVLHTDFGSINLTMPRDKEVYSYDISVKFGSITFDGQRLRDQSALTSGTTMENHLKLSSSSGDIKVSFES